MTHEPKGHLLKNCYIQWKTFKGITIHELHLHTLLVFFSKGVLLQGSIYPGPKKYSTFNLLIKENVNFIKF